MAATGEIRTLADLARVNAHRQPEKTAFVFEDRETSYAAFDRHTSQVAQGLLGLSVRPQDRIAYIGKNSDQYFELVVGAAKINAVMTPINWRLAPPEVAYILHDCGAKAVFVEDEFADLIPKQSDTVAAPPRKLSMRDFASWRNRQDTADPGLVAGWDDVCLQLYTSGTTGRPKGAMLTTRGIISSREAQAREPVAWNLWTSEDVALVAMPCFHIGGTAWGVTSLYYGAKGVVMREFDPTRVLEFFVRYGVTKLFLVPAAMQIVLRQPNARSVDYSRLKYILYGASPIPLDLLREAITVFGCGFVQMYGMTETSGTIVALPPEDHSLEGGARMRSAGKPLPGVEIAILDEAGAPLPPGAVGEIVTRSDANMIGYWNLPDATAQTLAPDNWLRTGDAGYVDTDGYVYVHDRVKDMIISGGENIYPAEVESAIYGHSAVADVAVIGVPDERWGEAVKAMVVLKPGASVSEAEVIAYARAMIAAYKCPKSVDFIDALPRNPSGKILRRELRAPFWEGRTRQVN
ncbi:MAG: fatty acid--CoA ligase [Caulobacterales bacterium]